MEKFEIEIAIKEYKMAKQRIARVLPQIEEYLKSDAPLQERWGAYLLFEDELPIHYCETTSLSIAAQEYNGYDELSCYDDLCMERGCTMTFSDVIERLNNNLYDQKPKEFLKFKEAVLKGGFGGFTNDW